MEWVTAEHSLGAFLPKQALMWVSVLCAAPRSHGARRKSLSGTPTLIQPG